jgi:hypothetical protein
MSCGGLNTFVAVPVPAVNGDGPILSVTGLVAKKTFFFSGPFEGEYVVLGSHNDVNFVPIAQIEGQEAVFGTSGPQTIQRKVELTLKSIRIRRLSNKPINIAVSAQAICLC